MCEELYLQGFENLVGLKCVKNYTYKVLKTLQEVILALQKTSPRMTNIMFYPTLQT
jgi:hypothetical protein